VKIHVTAILRALNVTNRTEALVAVSRLGLRLDALIAPKTPPSKLAPSQSGQVLPPG
jgi:hypothetical protein